MLDIFGILATPLGYAMEFLYNLIGNYGITIILFTLLIRVVMFPLTLKQQKSQARMSAYQPMMQEIQKKWANDKNRQQQEMMKFQEENNIKMTAGCAPMLVNMLVIFGVIAVIQSPLTHILRIDANQVTNGEAIVMTERDSAPSAFALQSILIGEVREDPQRFIDGVEVTDDEGNTRHVQMSEESVEKISSFDFDFLGLNLATVPTFSLSQWVYLIWPVLSILTMFGSQLIVMRTSGQTQGRGTMWIMTIVMGVMFGTFAFTIPIGFSLYYTASNVFTTVQQLIAKKIYDPEKAKQQVLDEIEERKKAKKAKKSVKIKDDSGNVVTAELTESELDKLRLAKARELDAQRYADEEADAPADKKKEKPAKEKAQQAPPSLPEAPSEQKEEADETEQEAATEAEPPEPTPDQPYKPGRRKRAKQNKEKTEPEEETSFAEQEQAAEQKED